MWVTTKYKHTSASDACILILYISGGTSTSTGGTAAYNIVAVTRPSRIDTRVSNVSCNSKDIRFLYCIPWEQYVHDSGQYNVEHQELIVYTIWSKLIQNSWKRKSNINKDMQQPYNKFSHCNWSTQFCYAIVWHSIESSRVTEECKKAWTSNYRELPVGKTHKDPTKFAPARHWQVPKLPQ